MVGIDQTGAPRTGLHIRIYATGISSCPQDVAAAPMLNTQQSPA